MSGPVVWRWRRTDMKEGWAKWMYQETEPTRETLGNVMDIAEVEPLYAHPEDAPRITMTKSYLSGRQCCDFTVAEDDSETHEKGCPWRLVDEFARAVYKMDEDGKVVAPWLHDLIVGLEDDLCNSPIRHPEDATTNGREVVGSSAPGGPWEYRETGDGKWVVFDSFPVSHERVPRSHDKITALSEASAKMVRDALNHGEANG